MTPAEPHDWLEHLRAQAERGASELSLSGFQAGDVVVVQTLHTRYVLCWQADGSAELTTDRPDRPAGRVRVNGCTFGASSTIKPDALFTGGNLEFVSHDAALQHRTTSIQSLHWLRRSRGGDK